MKVSVITGLKREKRQHVCMHTELINGGDLHSAEFY